MAVAGAGIIGLATAYELARRGHRVTRAGEGADRRGPSDRAQLRGDPFRAVLPARQPEGQAGHGRGAVHAGLRAGARCAGRDLRQARGRDHDAEQVPALRRLLERGRRQRGAGRGRSHRRRRSSTSRTCGAWRRCGWTSTGIVDFRGVCAALVRLIVDAGGEIRCGSAIVGIGTSRGGVVTAHDRSAGDHRRLVRQLRRAAVGPAGPAGRASTRTCGSSRSAGSTSSWRPSQRHLVKTLIYPVPDPTLPFLGVHLTRMINGGVHAGPNAVLALAREGYTLGGGPAAGRRRLPALARAVAAGRRYWRTGLGEVWRSVSRSRFLASLRGWCPALADDCLRSGARRGARPGPASQTAPWSTTSTSCVATVRSTSSTRRRRPPPQPSSSGVGSLTRSMPRPEVSRPGA